MRRWLVVLSLCAVTVGTVARPASAQPMEPAALIDAYTAALNSGDVEGALAFVAEEAVYLRPGGRFVGRDEVRGFIEGLVAQRARIELLGERRTFGNYVMWMSRVTMTSPLGPDAAPVVLMNQSESIVRDGQIVFHMATRLPPPLPPTSE